MCSLYTDSSADALGDTFDQLDALEGAVRREKLRVAAELDRRRVWEDDGCGSMTEWIAYRRGVSARAARGWARMARALEELPATAERMAEGRLSEDKVRSICDLAAPDTDADWAARAEDMTPAALARWARRAHRVRREEEDEARRTRDLRMWWDHGRGQLRLSGRLAAAQGAALEQAVRIGAERAGRDPDTGEYEPYGSRCADALTALAEVKLAGEPNRDRATIVVHVDGELIRGGSDGELVRGEGRNDVRLRFGAADIQGGPAIGWATLEELGADARWQLVARGPDGRAIGIGRVNRTVPFPLERELRHRDVTCRWPGCERSVALHAHHVVPWSAGGATDASNLCLLCPKHHRRLHREGWRIDGDADDVLRFVRPDGRPLRTSPPPLRGDLRRRFLGDGAAPPQEGAGSVSAGSAPPRRYAPTRPRDVWAGDDRDLGCHGSPLQDRATRTARSPPSKNPGPRVPRAASMNGTTHRRSAPEGASSSHNRPRWRRPGSSPPSSPASSARPSGRS